MIVLTTQGPRNKFLSEEGGGTIFLASLFLLNYVLFNVFIYSPSLWAGPCYNEIWIAFVML